MEWFNALVSWVNSIPPCDRIDCVPDFLEELFAAILSWIAAVVGV